MQVESSREAKKGGTVSVWVDRVTCGSPNERKMLSRPGSAGWRLRWAWYFAASGERWAKRKSATSFSWPVVESMSTSARVSSKRFIALTQMGGSLQKGRNRERVEPRGSHLSIALHP